nr:acyl carrier protein [Microbacterium pseudoresistens]
MKLVAEILEIEEVAENADLEDLGWDSLSNLNFIAEVDERANIAVDADKLSEARTVTDLFSLLNA